MSADDVVLKQNFVPKKSTYLPLKSTYLPSNLPKPAGKKFSPKIPIGKKGTTLQPTKMGKGVGGGVKATFKFK